MSIVRYRVGGDIVDALSFAEVGIVDVLIYHFALLLVQCWRITPWQLIVKDFFDGLPDSGTGCLSLAPI